MKQTVFFKNKPRILSGYSIVGPKEGKSPFASYFDYIINKDTFGEKTFEKTERKMLEHAIFGAVDKAKLNPAELEMIISGDLLNQNISSSFAARDFKSVYLGLFGACSTMVEGIAIGSSLVDGGYFKKVACATSSHFSTAERQFRFPLELGNQRPPTSQWTVTGAASTILSNEGGKVYVSCATFGKVVDYGIKDVNNMGAAMAPAAADTLEVHLKETKTKPEDYNMIFTGDLSKLGSEIFIDLLERKGIKMGVNYSDCGQMYFNKHDGTFMGGSGAGCVATVLNSYILKKLETGEFKKVLVIATGALLSTTSGQQGDSIPGIAHAVVLEHLGETNK